MFETLIIILEQFLVHVPLLCGAYFSFSRIKVPDLSIESAYLMGALCATFPLAFFNNVSITSLVACCVCSLLGGALVGLTSSCISYYGSIPHLLSSIVTFGIYHGVFQLISSSYISLSSYSNPLTLVVYNDHFPELIALIGIGMVVTGLFMYVSYTQLGYCLGIYGYNPSFFAYHKISSAYVFITGITLANSLAGLSGYLFAQTNRFVELNMGIGKALFCITALILGKSLSMLYKDTYVPYAGGIFYFALQQALLYVGISSKYFTSFQALIIVIILIIVQRKSATTINLGL